MSVKILTKTVAALLAVLPVTSVMSQTPTRWTGDGGANISLTILAPEAPGLAEDLNYLPALIQSEFVGNFSAFSAIRVLDWENLDRIYEHMMSEMYDDAARERLDLGHMAHTSHILTASLTRGASGYNLQARIVRTSDKSTAAQHTGAVSFLELDNLTGIRRASLALLQQVGVTLTAEARQQLVGAAESDQMVAQAAFARGITAQRHGSEVAALSHFLQAAAFNPALREAANRSSRLHTSLSSGNMGDNVRDDIAWRRQWVARLEETERFFDGFNRTDPMPYVLIYTTDIKQGAINYQNETVVISIETNLRGNAAWARSIERTLQTVWDGLHATGRMETWQLNNWPRQSVSGLRPFESGRTEFAVGFELLNNAGAVIGRETLRTRGSWSLSWSSVRDADGHLRSRPGISISQPDRNTLRFQNVNAGDITDNMTIRVASVNGADAGSVASSVLQIRASDDDGSGGGDGGGGTTFADHRDGQIYRTVRIGNRTWLAQNMNFEVTTIRGGFSRCYNNNPAGCQNGFGRLYNWVSAKAACEGLGSGWRLPTNADWDDLVTLAGGRRRGAPNLRAQRGWGEGVNSTDQLGFSALPAGIWGYASHLGYTGRGGSTNWWSATENSRDPSSAFQYGIGSLPLIDRNKVHRFSMPKSGTWEYSVRCVRD